MTLTRFAPLALLPLLLAGCGSAGETAAASGKLQVVTTVAPITSIAANIGGDRITLVGMVPEGTNSHTFEPPPSAAEVLSKADIVFIYGLKLEDPTRELAESNKKSGADIVEAFKKKYNEDYWLMSSHSAIAMLSKAIKQTGSTDPVKVAFAMEGMTVKSLNGDVEMRKSDHQALQPIYISTWTKTNGKDVRFDQENTGYGWKTDQKIETFVATQPTSCQMKRPGA